MCPKKWLNRGQIFSNTVIFGLQVTLFAASLGAGVAAVASPLGWALVATVAFKLILLPALLEAKRLANIKIATDNSSSLLNRPKAYTSAVREAFFSWENGMLFKQVRLLLVPF